MRQKMTPLPLLKQNQIIRYILCFYFLSGFPTYHWRSQKIPPFISVQELRIRGTSPFPFGPLFLHLPVNFVRSQSEVSQKRGLFKVMRICRVALW